MFFRDLISYLLPRSEYATEKIISHNFAGNGLDFIDEQSIFEILPTYTNLVIRPFDSGKTIFSTRLFRNDSSQSLYNTCMLIFGKDSVLSPEKPNSYLYEINNFQHVNFGSELNVTYDPVIGFSFLIYYSDLLNDGFVENDKIYCQAFLSNLALVLQWNGLTGDEIFGPSYIDISTNKRIYTGFGNNHPEVKSFILP